MAQPDRNVWQVVEICLFGVCATTWVHHTDLRPDKPSDVRRRLLKGHPKGLAAMNTRRVRGQCRRGLGAWIEGRYEGQCLVLQFTNWPLVSHLISSDSHLLNKPLNQ
jgi:hypothetical protein